MSIARYYTGGKKNARSRTDLEQLPSLRLATLVILLTADDLEQLEDGLLVLLLHR
jgi:hypothetical protein